MSSSTRYLDEGHTYRNWHGNFDVFEVREADSQLTALGLAMHEDAILGAILLEGCCFFLVFFSPQDLLTVAP